MSGQSLCSIVGVKCEETVMAPYIDGSNGDYDEDYYDLSSLFVPVMLDKPKDISMLLPPFILEELAVIEPKVKSVSEDNNEGDSQVSESHDNDELSIVDEELHKLVEQKLNDFSTDILSKSYGDYHGDYRGYRDGGYHGYHGGDFRGDRGVHGRRSARGHHQPGGDRVHRRGEL